MNRFILTISIILMIISAIWTSAIFFEGNKEKVQKEKLASFSSIENILLKNLSENPMEWKHETDFSGMDLNKMKHLYFNEDRNITLIYEESYLFADNIRHIVVEQTLDVVYEGVTVYTIKNEQARVIDSTFYKKIFQEREEARLENLESEKQYLLQEVKRKLL